MGNVCLRGAMRRYFFSSFLLLTAAFSLTAQQLSVAYLEGRAEVRSGSNWAMLSIGDTVSTDGVLRLGDDAYMVLRGAGASLTFSQQGTYSIHKLVSIAQKN